MATTPRGYDAPDEHDGAAAAMAFVWVLFAFKLATVVLIFWHMGTVETAAILGSTLWYWFPVVGVLASGPILFRWRLRRVRARRDALRRAEWMLDQRPGFEQDAEQRPAQPGTPASGEG